VLKKESPRVGKKWERGGQNARIHHGGGEILSGGEGKLRLPEERGGGCTYYGPDSPQYRP